MAGQSVRLIDLPADAGKGFGVFDYPGETGNAKDLADAIKLTASTHYGTAGPAFIKRLLQLKIGEVQAAIKQSIAKFRQDNLPAQADGQVQRAADHFGLVAAAGELAIELEIVPWPASSAYTAACECFEAFLDRRGGLGRAEERYAIGRVRRFIEAHGESRFEETGDNSLHPRVVVNRAGFRQGKGEAEEWWVLPETWREEICAGLDPTQVVRILARRGMLLRDAKGFTIVKRIEGRPTRVYVLTSKILAGDGNE
jgi:putative DNA primase/helicase